MDSDTYLMAALVPANATINRIDEHLAVAIPHLPASWYRLGGQFTGAWDGYQPSNDPQNRRLCPSCTGDGCPACRDTPPNSQPAGTVVAPYHLWVRHPGDLLPLPRLLDPNWRFPTRLFGTANPQTTAPTLYSDRFYGLRALDRTGSGETSNGLRSVLRAVADRPEYRYPNGEPFQADDWQLALIDARIPAADLRAILPGLGSVVIITDPDLREDDAPHELLHVVRDDFHAPDLYDLLRLGDIGPHLPGYALAEIDPALIRLTPAVDGSAPYPPQRSDTDEPRR